MTPRIAAATNGLKRYTAKPCRVCACTERYTSSGSCTECNDRRSRAAADKVRVLLKGSKVAA